MVFLPPEPMAAYALVNTEASKTKTQLYVSALPSNVVSTKVARSSQVYVVGMGLLCRLSTVA